uniref:Ig-like domain-containing protein n=1 Tax=Cyprinus carpio carpio TaxID=630221 RepID=A0A9J8AN07_CYPCA
LHCNCCKLIFLIFRFHSQAADITLPKVKILPPSPKELCSQNKTDKWSTLVCVATGFYPDHVSVSWKVNGEERQDRVSTDTSPQQNKTTLMYHISSRMKIDDMDWIDPKNNFTCTVHFFNGKAYVNVTNTINGQKVKPKGLKLLGFGYILFLSKSLLYALIVAGVVCKYKVIPDNYKTQITHQICINSI